MRNFFYFIFFSSLNFFLFYFAFLFLPKEVMGEYVDPCITKHIAKKSTKKTTRKATKKATNKGTRKTTKKATTKKKTHKGHDDLFSSSSSPSLDSNDDNNVAAAQVRSERKRLSQTERAEIASGQGWRCQMCDHLLPAEYEIDHAEPLFKGGADEKHNMQALCRNCHGHKSMRERIGEFKQSTASRVLRFAKEGCTYTYRKCVRWFALPAMCATTAGMIIMVQQRWRLENTAWYSPSAWLS